MSVSVSEPSASNEKKSRLSQSPIPIPTVSEENGILALHFQSEYVQSQMMVDDPDSLALAYSRTMMAFELFRPMPLRVAMIGLGGGSMAKWCYRHHPQADLTVAEINPHVIALRDRFSIPRDDHRFSILCANGADFVAQHASRFDVLLVDVFGVDRLPAELCSARFYEDCYRSLTESGLLVVNLCGKNNRRSLGRIRKRFDDKVLLSPDADGNTVVFACKGELPWRKGETARSFQIKLKRFEKKHGLRKAMAPIT